MLSIHQRFLHCLVSFFVPCRTVLQAVIVIYEYLIVLLYNIRCNDGHNYTKQRMLHHLKSSVCIRVKLSEGL